MLREIKALLEQLVKDVAELRKEIAELKKPGKKSAGGK